MAGRDFQARHGFRRILVKEEVESMSNTMLAEQPDIADYDYAPRTAPSTQRRSVGASPRSKYRSHRASAQLERLTVLVMLACSLSFVFVGVCYLGAFAGIISQSRQITSINTQLATSAAQHETLIKQVASLQSDHRIGPLAQQLNMSQAGANPFIDVMQDQRVSGREIASAQ
jgi:cell division protein FtsL